MFKLSRVFVVFVFIFVGNFVRAEELASPVMATPGVAIPVVGTPAGNSAVAATTPEPTPFAPPRVRKSRSKVSYQFQDFNTRGGSKPAFLFGIQVAKFVGGNNCTLGLDINFANFYGSQPNQLIGVGLLFGHEKVSGRLLYGADVAGGIASFTNSINVNGDDASFYAKPEAFVGLVLGHGLRVSGNVNYDFVTESTAYSGYSFGLRLDYKIETIVRAIDD